MFGVIIHFSVSLKPYESIKLTYSDFLTRGVGIVNLRKTFYSAYIF